MIKKYTESGIKKIPIPKKGKESANAITKAFKIGASKDRRKKPPLSSRKVRVNN